MFYTVSKSPEQLLDSDSRSDAITFDAGHAFHSYCPQQPTSTSFCSSGSKSDCSQTRRAEKISQANPPASNPDLLLSGISLLPPRHPLAPPGRLARDVTALRPVRRRHCSTGRTQVWVPGAMSKRKAPQETLNGGITDMLMGESRAALRSLSSAGPRFSHPPWSQSQRPAASVPAAGGGTLPPLPPGTHVRGCVLVSSSPLLSFSELANFEKNVSQAIHKYNAYRYVVSRRSGTSWFAVT